MLVKHHDYYVISFLPCCSLGRLKKDKASIKKIRNHRQIYLMNKYLSSQNQTFVRQPPTPKINLQLHSLTKPYLNISYAISLITSVMSIFLKGLFLKISNYRLSMYFLHLKYFPLPHNYLQLYNFRLVLIGNSRPSSLSKINMQISALHCISFSCHFSAMYIRTHIHTNPANSIKPLALNIMKI